VIELIANILVGVEALLALVIIYLDLKEVRFLRRLQPYIDRDLPLFAALTSRALFVSLVGIYLILLTVLGAMFGPLSESFPLLRPINGLLFIGLLAGPYYTGREMRKRVDLPTEQQVSEADDDRRIGS